MKFIAATSVLSLLCGVAAVSQPTGSRGLATACNESCANNGASSYRGACQNGGTCNLDANNCIYCTGCKSGYTGYRCETPTATESCENNGASSYLGACQNGSTCTLNDAGLIYCTGCKTGYTGYRCETPPPGTSPAAPESCDNNGASSYLGPCQNGSTCTLNDVGLIWCQNCKPGYSGYRCEIPPAGSSNGGVPQSCDNNGASSPQGACQNGSTCKLNDKGYIYCENCPPSYTGLRCDTRAVGGGTPEQPAGTPPCAAGQTQCGGRLCCDDATQACTSGGRSSADVCVAKFGPCPANQPACGHGTNLGGAIFQDNKCCNLECPSASPNCNECVTSTGVDGTASTCAYSFSCAQSNPCQNGGTCNDAAVPPTGNRFGSCTCPAGYSGTFCQNAA